MKIWKIIAIILFFIIIFLAFKLITKSTSEPEKIENVAGINISTSNLESLLGKAETNIPFKLCSIKQDKCIGLIKKNTEQ